MKPDIRLSNINLKSALRLTIGKKIASGFGFAILAMTLLGAIGASSLQDIVEHVEDMLLHEDIRYAISAARVDHLEWSQQLVSHLFDDKKLPNKVELDPAQCSFGVWLRDHDLLSHDDYLQALMVPFNNIAEPHEKLHQSAVEIYNQLDAGDIEKARQIYAQETVLYINDILAMVDGMDNLLDKSNEGLDSLLGLSHSISDRYAIVWGVSVFLLFLVAYFIGRDVINVLRNSVSVLSSSSREIAATSEQHYRVLEQQLSAINQTTGTIDELDASASETTENAGHASMTANEVANRVRKAREVSEEMEHAMQNLQARMKTIVEHAMRLSEQSIQKRPEFSLRRMGVI